MLCPYCGNDYGEALQRCPYCDAAAPRRAGSAAPLVQPLADDETPPAPEARKKPAVKRPPDPAADREPEQPNAQNGRKPPTVPILCAVIGVLAGAATVFGVLYLREKKGEKPVSGETVAAETTTDAFYSVPAATAESTLPAAASIPGATTAGAGEYENRTGGVINLRLSPGTNSERVGALPDGARVTVTELWTDSAATETALKKWGKVSFNGTEGWAAMYYLTPTPGPDTPLDEAALTDLYQKLNGFWNTENRRQYFSLTLNNGVYYLGSGAWYSEADLYAAVSGVVTGDANRIVSIPVYQPAVTTGAYASPEFRGSVQLDLSLLSIGVLRWKTGSVWERGTYAGSTPETAMPPEDAMTDPPTEAPTAAQPDIPTAPAVQPTATAPAAQ